ncbi:MAG TPA: S-methyl-5-thioribose kinase [Bacillales bacterium]
MSDHSIPTEKDIVEYVKSIPDLFPVEDELTCREISDGNMNLVFRIQEQNAEGKSVIVKQAIPYMRAIGDSWPLTTDRIRIEYETLKKQYALCADLVPEVYHYNGERKLMVMEDLLDFHVLREGLIAQRQYPRFPEQIGRFLARTLLSTSIFTMKTEEKKQAEARFSNPEMCKLTEDFFFTFPYFDHEMNNVNPHLERLVRKFREDQALKIEAARMKEKFMTNKQGLLHGDLHTGSIMVTESETKVIDPEFAFYGPMGFDIGSLLANFLLNFVAQPPDNKDHRVYLLRGIQDIWINFGKEWRKLFAGKVHDSLFANGDYMNAFLTATLQDSAGFAGCEMIRRTIGTSHVEDFEFIKNPELRAQAEIKALEIGKKLILNPIHTIAQFLSLIQ